MIIVIEAHLLTGLRHQEAIGREPCVICFAAQHLSRPASGNRFIHFAPSIANSVVASDDFVVRGVPGGRRKIYKIWEEGKGRRSVSS